MEGWTDAINKYFIARNMSGFVDQFKLQMQPIVTNMSTVVSERRDSAVNQATQLVDLMKSLGIEDDEVYKKIIQESLKESFPQAGSEVMTWKMNVKDSGGASDEF